MLKKTLNRLQFCRKIRPVLFLYYNYVCNRITRKDHSKIIPYKRAVLDMKKGSRITLSGGDLEIGCDKLSGSKAETLIRLRENAVWNNNGGCKISYGCTVEILIDAEIDNQYFTMNSNSTMIARSHISLGNDVMIARNVVIYDSDFHDLLDEKGKIINDDGKITIGDHVWIGTNCMILKGVNIASNSVVAGGTIITSDIDSGTLVGNQRMVNEIKDHINWRR